MDKPIPFTSDETPPLDKRNADTDAPGSTDSEDPATNEGNAEQGNVIGCETENAIKLQEHLFYPEVEDEVATYSPDGGPHDNQDPERPFRTTVIDTPAENTNEWSETLAACQDNYHRLLSKYSTLRKVYFSTTTSISLEKHIQDLEQKLELAQEQAASAPTLSAPALGMMEHHGTETDNSQDRAPAPTPPTPAQVTIEHQMVQAKIPQEPAVKPESSETQKLQDSTRENLVQATQTLLWNHQVSFAIMQALASRVTDGHRFMIDGQEVTGIPQGRYTVKEVLEFLKEQERISADTIEQVYESVASKACPSFDLDAEFLEDVLAQRDPKHSLQDNVRKLYEGRPLPSQGRNGKPKGQYKAGPQPRSFTALQASREASASREPTGAETDNNTNKEEKKTKELNAPSIKRILSRRRAAEIFLVLHIRPIDIDRTRRSVPLQLMFSTLNVIVPEGAEMQVSNTSSEKLAWVCQVEHASGVIPLMGYGHTTCGECHSKKKQLMMDFCLPKMAVYLHLREGWTIKGPKGSLYCDDKLMATPTFKDTAFTLHGDKTSWTLGDTFEKQLIPMLGAPQKTAEASKSNSTAPSIESSSMTGIRQNAKNQPKLKLNLRERRHRGKLQDKYNALPERAASRRDTERERVIAFHTRRMCEIFDTGSRSETEVASIVKRMIEHLVKHKVVNAAQWPAEGTKDDITKAAAGPFDLTQSWFILRDLTGFESTGTLTWLMFEVEKKTGPKPNDKDEKNTKVKHQEEDDDASNTEKPAQDKPNNSAGTKIEAAPTSVKKRKHKNDKDGNTVEARKKPKKDNAAPLRCETTPADQIASAYGGELTETEQMVEAERRNNLTIAERMRQHDAQLRNTNVPDWELPAHEFKAGTPWHDTLPRKIALTLMSYDIAEDELPHSSSNSLPDFPTSVAELDPNAYDFNHKTATVEGWHPNAKGFCVRRNSSMQIEVFGESVGVFHLDKKGDIVGPLQISQHDPRELVPSMYGEELSGKEYHDIQLFLRYEQVYWMERCRRTLAGDKRMGQLGEKMKKKEIPIRLSLMELDRDRSPYDPEEVW